MPQVGAKVLASFADPYAFLSFTLSMLIAEWPAQGKTWTADRLVAGSW